MVTKGMSNKINENQEEVITAAINKLTEKLSTLLLDELLKLPAELQTGFVLIKTAQLLLSNILCQVATNKDSLDKIADAQGEEIKVLTLDCAFMGFADKFDLQKH